MSQARETLLAPVAYDFELFIIHAAADSSFVRGYLLPALNLPLAQVLLIDALPLGGLIIAEIDRGVARSRFTVAVLSPAYLADCWAVFGEQLASQISIEHPRVIPLRLADCELPLHLDARVSVDFTDRARWEGEAARLRDWLHAPAPVETRIPCPYPGMRPFAITDASEFFGRNPEIEDLLAQLDRGEREIYVIGPSGSGKSSLVHAGLLPVLHSGSSRLGRSFVACAMRPGERPADRLAKLLDGDPATPGPTVDAFVARHPPAYRVLVFVDQLEELFTVASAAERQRFTAALRALRAEPRCYFVLGLRADFYGALMDSALWPERASPARLDVAPLRGTALAEAIRSPAIRVGVYLEARLCDRLVNDADDEPGVLPLLQETLRLLWDKRHHRLLGLEAYEALGKGGRGLDVAIAMRADMMMNGLTPAQQTITRRVLVRLVSFGEGRADTRRQQEIRALRSAADDDSEFWPVLEQLVGHRLVTVDRTERDHGALADLSHEALITAWPALRLWLDGKRSDELRRRRLEAKIAEWIERGRGTASLLDPVELSEAVQWTASDAARELGYGADLPALMAASRSEIERTQQQRRQRTIRAFAVLAVFSLVASMLGIVALRQRHEAQRKAAEAQRLLAMSYLERGRSLLLDGHSMQALPYLVAARIEAIEGPVIRMLFAQAARDMPLVNLIGHTSNVRTAAFSPDGKRVVTASDDKTARVWDAETGELVTGPLEHSRGVRSAVFSPDGKRIVTVSEDRTAQLWDAATGKPLTFARHQSSVPAAGFRPDGTPVITTSEPDTALLWDATTGEAVTAPLEHHGAVERVELSPDGTRVITANTGELLLLWNAKTGKRIARIAIEAAFTKGAWFSPDGARFITATVNGTVLWDTTTGEPVPMVLEHRSAVSDAAFSPDGTRAITASWDRTARIWDAATGKPVTPPLQHQTSVRAAAFSPDGTQVVTASDDHTARVWDATTGEPMTAWLEHAEGVNAAVFSPDGTRVLTASEDRTARIWAARGNRTGELLEHHDFIRSAAFSPDGTRVVTTSNDKTARVWDAATGKPVTPPLEHQDSVAVASFSPNGTRVATVSGGAARVWDATSGKPVTPPLEIQGSMRAAAFSPDGTHLVTASSAGAHIWDAITGKAVAVPFEEEDWVDIAAFSPDGTRVITGSEAGTAQVWDAATGKPVTPPLAHDGPVRVAAFSPDGTRVITGNDHIARVSDATTGKAVTPPLEYEGGTAIAAFSPNGMQLVTATSGTTVGIWDARTGKAVTPPLEHQDTVSVAAFSPAGTRVVTVSGNAARVWDTTTGKPVTGPLEHHEPIVSAAFSSDGTRIVTTSDDARIWDATTGTPLIWPLEVHATDHDAIRSGSAHAVFSQDGLRAIVLSDNQIARVWTFSLATGSLDDWRRLERCGPLVLGDIALTANPDPASVCTPNAKGK